jgi:uncharacterized metal-binding protein
MRLTGESTRTSLISDDILMVNELFLKLKSAELDRGVTARLESPTDSCSLALVSGSVLSLALTILQDGLFVLFDVFAKRGVRRAWRG